MGEGGGLRTGSALSAFTITQCLEGESSGRYSFVKDTSATAFGMGATVRYLLYPISFIPKLCPPVNDVHTYHHIAPSYKHHLFIPTSLPRTNFSSSYQIFRLGPEQLLSSGYQLECTPPPFLTQFFFFFFLLPIQPRDTHERAKVM